MICDSFRCTHVRILTYVRQSFLNGNSLNKEVDETDKAKSHRHDHQDHHEAHQHLLQVADFTSRCKKGGSLSEEGINSSELDSSLDFTTNDGGTHLTAVTLVECDGERFTGKSSLIDINFRAIYTAISRDCCRG